MNSIVSDYKNNHGIWQKSKRIDGKQCHTVSGNRWLRMNVRCTVDGYFQKEKPSYIGCKVSESFRDFNIFAEWHINSVGYGLKGYQLDKDILKSGNKIYCPELCILVPNALNSFFSKRISRNSSSNTIAITNGNFYSYITIRNKTYNLGLFSSKDCARAAYIAAKEAEGYRWYERLKSGEFIIDERVIERMRTWTLED